MQKYEAMLSIIAGDIPEYRFLDTGFQMPIACAWHITLKKATTLGGTLKLEVTTAQPKLLPAIFPRYPAFKAEWEEKKNLAKQNPSYAGISFVLVTYISAVRVAVYTKKKQEKVFPSLPKPAHPDLWLSVLNSTIEQGRIYSFGSMDFKFDVEDFPQGRNK